MTDAIKIEKGVPIAKKVSGGGRNRLYPFPSMEVRDSFAIPLAGVMNAKGTRDVAAQKVSQALWHYTKATGRKFITRTIKDEGVVRVWRVS